MPQNHPLILLSTTTPNVATSIPIWPHLVEQKIMISCDYLETNFRCWSIKFIILVYISFNMDQKKLQNCIWPSALLMKTITIQTLIFLNASFSEIDHDTHHNVKHTTTFNLCHLILFPNPCHQWGNEWYPSKPNLSPRSQECCLWYRSSQSPRTRRFPGCVLSKLLAANMLRGPRLLQSQGSKPYKFGSYSQNSGTSIDLPILTHQFMQLLLQYSLKGVG